MFDWLDLAYAQQLPRHRETPLPPGATDAEIAKLVKLVGPLSRSHEAFLRKCNGLPELFGVTLLVLSVDEIIAWHEEWCPFQSFNGKPELCEGGDEYYVEKPKHLLVVKKQAHGNEVECLDTSVRTADESPIVRYDLDNDPPLYRPRPSFEAMLLSDIAAAAEYDSKPMHAELIGMLTARGVKRAADWDPDYSDWR